MMLPFQAVVQTPIQQVVARAVSAHQSMRTVSAKVTVASVGVAGLSSLTYGVRASQPNRAQVSIVKPRSGKVAASNRVFTVLGAAGYGRDLGTNEWLQRDVGKGTLAERMTRLLGPLDDGVRFILDPTSASRFLKLLQKQQGWSISQDHGLTRAITKDASHSTELVLDSHGRIVKISIGALSAMGGAKAKSQLTTSISYQPEAAISFAPTGRKVDTFHEQPVQPRYADAAAKQLVNAAVARYWQPGTLVYAVEEDGMTTRVEVGGGKARQSGSSQSWAFDGQTLTIFSRSARTVWRGRVERAKVLDCLASHKTPMEPFVRSLWLGRNPIADLLSPDMTVRKMGTIRQQGSPTSLLELAAPGYRLQLQVLSSGLISSAISHSLDARGAVAATHTRRFSYGQKPTGFSMAVPKGFAVRPL